MPGDICAGDTVEVVKDSVFYSIPKTPKEGVHVKGASSVALAACFHRPSGLDHDHDDGHTDIPCLRMTYPDPDHAPSTDTRMCLHKCRVQGHGGVAQVHRQEGRALLRQPPRRRQGTSAPSTHLPLYPFIYSPWPVARISCQASGTRSEEEEDLSSEDSPRSHTTATHPKPTLKQFTEPYKFQGHFEFRELKKL